MKNFLEFSYDELEKLNLEAKAKAASGTPNEELKEHYVNYLEGESGIKAVTL